MVLWRAFAPTRCVTSSSIGLASCALHQESKKNGAAFAIRCASLSGTVKTAQEELICESCGATSCRQKQ